MANFAHAWIGWNNYLTNAAHTVTVSSAASGYPALNLRNWFSWQRWRGADGAGTWDVTVDCGGAKPVSYAAVCAHSGLQALAFAGSNDGTTWTNIVTFAQVGITYSGTYTYNGAVSVGTIPVTDKNISLRFDTVSYRYYRFRFTGTATPAVGVLAIGPALDFPRGFYGGFVRPKWNVEVETTNSKSERGVFLGRSVVRSGGKPFAVNLDHVPHAWVDDYWQPFREHADLYPFIFTWEPDPLDLVNGTINNTDCVLAWLRDWKPSALKNQRFASIGGEFEGTLQ